MSRSYETTSTTVLCPFFIGKDRSRITCEGIIGGSSISIAFASPADCKQWKKEYCDRAYQSCNLAELLNAKWDKALERRH